MTSYLCILTNTVWFGAFTTNVMLIAFTRRCSLERQERLKALGFDKQMIKPVQPSELSRELAVTWQQLRHIVEPESIVPTRPRVLLVEDNIFSQKVTKVMLEGLGYEVDFAPSGQQALQLMQRRYDLIFMDLGLPDMDGIEITKQIRLGNNNNRHTYICALTAHANDVERRKCLAAGMNEFLTKPARLEEFQKIINTAVGQRRWRTVQVV